MVLIFILLHLPAVQSFIGSKVSDALSDKLGTKVEVGRVDLGFLNRITIDDVTIYDQADKKMLSSSRLSAKVDITPLFSGKISVSSAQAFGLNAILYKENDSIQPNYQFFLDSLASKEPTEKTPLHLNINSLIIRNGHIKYDQLDKPVTENRFNPRHLDFTNVSGHLILNEMTDEHLDLKVKKLSLKERCGIDMKRMSFELFSTKKESLLTDLKLELPGTTLLIDTLKADYRFKDDKIDMPSLCYHMSMPTSVITPSDLSSLLPSFRDFTDPLSISAQIDGNSNSLVVDEINIRTEGEALKFSADGFVSNWDTQMVLKANIHELNVKSHGIEKILRHFGDQFSLPPQVTRLGDVDYHGQIGVNGKEIAMDGQLHTEAGDSQLSWVVNDKHFSGVVETDGFQLGHVLMSDHFGKIATAIQLDGYLPFNKNMSVTAKGNISHLEYDNHTYENIYVDGTYDDMSFKGVLGIDDPNGEVEIDGEFDLHTPKPIFNLNANIKRLKTDAFGLSGPLSDKQIDLNAVANLKGTQLNEMEGSLSFNDLHISSNESVLSLNSMDMDIGMSPNGERHVIVDCDYGHVSLNGKIDDYSTVGKSIINVLQKKLPARPFFTAYKDHYSNDFTIDATISDTEWLRQFTDFDIHLIQPLTVNGSIDEPSGVINLTCSTDHFIYNGNEFSETDIELNTIGDTLYCSVKTQKENDNGRPLELKLKAKGADNQLFSDINFDNHGEKVRLRGTLSTLANYADDLTGHQEINLSMLPSQIFLNDTLWHVASSGVTIAKKDIRIDNLVIGNGRQNITVSGKATESPMDAINLRLHEVNMSYLSSILHVRNVDFGGSVTGDARLTSLFNEPQAIANLNVDDFRFVDGRIGEMKLDVDWNAHDKMINLNGVADDDGNKTKVDGNIVLSPLELNIQIHADGTPIQFLERYCGSFLNDVKARVKGDIRIFGPSKNINLEGKVIADGAISLPALNTTYTMVNDTITLIPDHILFSADTIVDKHGNIGTVNGEVTHTHLRNFGYDLLIHADDMLAYDFKEFGNQTFCGTVYATGDCHIQGEPDEVLFDINVTPSRNTVFYYNAAGPDALSGQEFIQWNDNSPNVTALQFEGLRPTNDESTEQATATLPQPKGIPANLRMNFLINANPDATLRILMDEGSGDYIALNGTGTLRANYFNKGNFNLYGNYVVDHGIYRLTIQNILRKDFQFQPGGSITFVGNPYDATLALKAIYTVNGVPLSDLNLGRSFTSNNIRVNCLMNINGTAEQPTVDFDMEMPTVSSDAQQMVRSIISSEEELNQQVIYLLTIGRFYNRTNYTEMGPERQSQTSLAMQSLLSGTISQQINTLLGSIINNNNWNFGANISTGDEGWNNAEYEGILSGRLLDNRLQINGQFGYRDNPNATTSFIGDFDIRYLLYPNGNMAVKVYNQTNDRYFIKNSLNTQGVGLIMKKDFNGWRELLGINRKKDKKLKSDK